jgi:hypothetical protein
MPDDVKPFLENVTQGRNVPRERLFEVAELNPFSLSLAIAMRVFERELQ